MMLQYNIGEAVLYSAHSVCRIESIEEKDVGGAVAKYYVLKPVFDNLSTIYLPIDSEKSTSKIRPVLSPEEILELIKSIPGEVLYEIEDETERKAKYRDILNTCDRAELIRMIKTLNAQKRERLALGKKPLVNDEFFIKKAEKILYDEFAHVLEIRPEDVLQLITEQIGAVAL